MILLTVSPFSTVPCTTASPLMISAPSGRGTAGWASWSVSASAAVAAASGAAGAFSCPASSVPVAGAVASPSRAGASAACSVTAGPGAVSVSSELQGRGAMPSCPASRPRRITRTKKTASPVFFMRYTPNSMAYSLRARQLSSKIPAVPSGRGTRRAPCPS